MKTFRHIAMATLAAPLALTLAACGSEDTAAGDVDGEPVAAVEAPAGSEWSLQAVRTEQGGWLVGNPDAPIKLVEYGSLTCPTCARFSIEGSEKLHREYIDTGRVNYELRSVMIHGIVDLLLTRMLECGSVNAAVPLADQIWSDVNAVTDPFSSNGAAVEQAFAMEGDERFFAVADAAEVVDYFSTRGISREQARACLTDGAAIQQLAESSQADAEEADVTGTPTFFINGLRVDGTTWSVVEPALQQAGAR